MRQMDLTGKGLTRILHVRLGLTQTQTAVAVFPLATLFQQVDALETLQHVALCRNLTLTL